MGPSAGCGKERKAAAYVVAQDRHRLRWRADGAANTRRLLTYGLRAGLARSAASLQMAAAQKASVQRMQRVRLVGLTLALRAGRLLLLGTLVL